MQKRFLFFLSVLFAMTFCFVYANPTPINAKGFYVQGVELYNQAKYEEAVKSLDIAIELNNEYKEA
ncbi:MAG TPA: hypothetical protein VEF53_20175, partial [Patescibacteria group bacterium]|nr:hypothetical protein [Patescibacteria group bacterium]